MTGDEPPTCAQNATPALAEIAEHAAQQLKDEPEAQEPARPDRMQEQEAERDQHVHPGMRVEDQVGTEHARVAPLAPIIGISEAGSGSAWAKAAAMPHSR